MIIFVFFTIIGLLGWGASLRKAKKLQTEIDNLKPMLSPETQEHLQLTETLANQRAENEKLQAKHRTAKFELENVEKQIAKAKTELIETNEEVLLQSFGMYKPHFEFANSTEYKDALAAIREKQKTRIKNGTAVRGATNWTVNGSAKQGAKMIADMQKLLLRAFNCECDDLVAHVRFNNIEVSEKRIHSSFSAISKLGAVCGVSITEAYRDLKIDELRLAHEYQIEKQKEKELLKQLRAEERERVKLEREIAEARRKVEKEQTHYENALAKVLQQLSHATGEEVAALEAKKAELEEQLGVLSEAMAQIDYREANQKAGYVYIISNVGAFGEGVYKIGMTRRLEPMDRIDELGDASVPFNFDVHALIFSEDAPGLEAALHRAFEDRKLNMVNTRREFFRVSLDEIKKVVTDNFDKTVEFVDIPAAEQYRQSELLRRAN